MPPPILAALFAHPDDETHAAERHAFLAHRSQLVHLDAFERDCLTPTKDFAIGAGTPQPAPIVDDLFAGLAGASPERGSGRRRP